MDRARMLMEQARLLRDRHGNFEQPLIAVRQHSGFDFGEARQPHLFECIVGDPARGRKDPAAHHWTPAVGSTRLRRDPDVLARRQCRK